MKTMKRMIGVCLILSICLAFAGPAIAADVVEYKVLYIENLDREDAVVYEHGKKFAAVLSDKLPELAKEGYRIVGVNDKLIFLERTVKK